TRLSFQAAKGSADLSLAKGSRIGSLFAQIKRAGSPLSAPEFMVWRPLDYSMAAKSPLIGIMRVTCYAVSRTCVLIQEGISSKMARFIHLLVLMQLSILRLR